MAIIAKFEEGVTKVFTKNAYQFDKGQELKLEGIEIPSGGEAHFSNDDRSGISVSVKIQNGSVKIPDGLFDTGDYIYVWLYARELVNAVQATSGYIMDPDDPEYDHLILNEAVSGSDASENSETLYEVVIPVIKRPAIVRVEGSGGEGTLVNNYAVEGENLILKK